MPSVIFALIKFHISKYFSFYHERGLASYVDYIQASAVSVASILGRESCRFT